MKIKVGKYTWNPIVLIRNIFVLICVLFLIWCAISYCEILIKNTSIDVRPVYSSWNVFLMFLK